MNTTAGMRRIFIGRQPIYDRAMKVYAYELLYRSGEENSAGLPDGDAATSQVTLNAFTEIGIENLVGQHLAFINLTRGFIIGDNPLPLTQGKVVLGRRRLGGSGDAGADMTSSLIYAGTYPPQGRSMAGNARSLTKS